MKKEYRLYWVKRFMEMMEEYNNRENIPKKNLLHFVHAFTEYAQQEERKHALWLKNGIDFSLMIPEITPSCVKRDTNSPGERVKNVFSVENVTNSTS